MKKIILSIAMLTLLLTLTTVAASAEGLDGAGTEIDSNVALAEDDAASITRADGVVYYDSLVDAVADVQNGETITLLKDTEGDGIVVPSGSDFTIDFGGHTYRILTTVGSTGTETNGMQLLRDSNLIFKNGTIERAAAGIQILIQNYSNLTLENITLDGTTGESANSCAYVLSNNYGDITLKGDTNINATGVAFDVYYWPPSYADGVSVTIDSSMTGTIDGDIEIATSDTTAEDLSEKVQLSINGGTFEGEFTSYISADKNPDITIMAGSFTDDVSDYVSKAAAYDPDTGVVTLISQENAMTSIERDGLTYYYNSLVDAIADVEDGETILLLKDARGDGIVVPEGSDFTIDFGGHSYWILNTVGSTGTKTNGMQLLKDSNLTFKNGTIERGALAAYILIQNYSNLTLEDMTLDGTTGNSPFLCSYVLSNNYGNITLKGNTNIKARNVAFDVCYWPNSTYSSGVSVTVDESMTGVIDGDVEISTYSDTEDNLSNLLQLNIKGGTFEGEFNNITVEANNPTIAITAGSFTDDVSAYVAYGYTMVQNSDGTNTVLQGDADSAITSKIAVELTPGADANTYDLMLVAEDGRYINRLSSAELKFALTLTEGAVDYEIVPAANINIVDLGENIYGFYFDGINEADATGQSLCVGSVVFTGYGSGTFACVEYPDAKVNTAEYSDNIVDTYIPTGDGTDTGLLTFGEAIELNLQPETSALTINVNFPNAIENNPAAYQQMRATISGGTLTEPRVIAFGTDAAVTDPETETFSFDPDTCTYTYTGAFVKNLTYNVTIEGEGYRTARYTVNLNEDKTLSFWNNVKDAAVAIEMGNDDSEANVTYLAGDIVMNNKIDIYDLSAVVSYFGEIDLNVEGETYNEGYAKYDLNRDGKIDSKDVAMVLVSWGK